MQDVLSQRDGGDSRVHQNKHTLSVIDFPCPCDYKKCSSLRPPFGKETYTVGLFSKTDRAFALAISDLAYCNPFLPDRIDAERRALGAEFFERPAVLSKRDVLGDAHPNIPRATERVRDLLSRLRPGAEALATAGRRAGGEEFQLYEDLVLFLLFHCFLREMDALVDQGAPRRVQFFSAFSDNYQHYFFGKAEPAAVAHTFALLFQLRRAFRHIFDYIIGESMPAARLRAAVWQSIFTPRPAALPAGALQPDG